MKRAFEHFVTAGRAWRPTEEGLNVFSEVFAVCFSVGYGSLEREEQTGKRPDEDVRVAELKTRFPHIYPRDVDIDLSYLGFPPEDMEVSLDEIEKYNRGYDGKHKRYRIVGAV